MRRRLLLPLAALLLGVRPGPSPDTEILWDDWGVPHVYAADEVGLARGFGRAMAEAHGELVLGLYRIAEGRAAESWAGEEWAESDRFVRTVGIPDRAETWYAALEPGERRLLDAFVDGFNGWAEANRASIADSLEVALPVRGPDVLAHLQRVVHFGFLLLPWDAAGRISDVAGPGGSNGWAIAPSKSASGHAMLLANPHLPWSGRFTWFEAHLVGPGVDFYGATLAGMPFLAVGFNDRLGWTHTVNPLDGADLYALEPVEGGYRWGGETRAFEVRTDTLRVKRADGTVRVEPFDVRSSMHGPVVGERDGAPLALRVVGLDQPHLIAQYRAMTRARDLASFEAALSRLQMPFFNVVYADANGRILYVFNGRIPRRPRGDRTMWSGVLDGTDPSLLWTEIHPYEDLPRVVDPESGWVQNANDPPWSSTWPERLDPADFPPYFAPVGLSFRPQRSIRMLREDPSISFEELVADKHSTRMEMADRWVDDLLAACRDSRDPRVLEGVKILSEWDRSADADRRGALLFALWVRELPPRHEGHLELAFAEPWTPDDPLETPDGLAYPDRAVDALAAAVSNLETNYGEEATWGSVFRLAGDSLDLPGNGAADPFGSFRVTGFATVRPGHDRAVFGDSWVAAVEFGDPIRAEGLLTYGNTSRPGDPHRWDQLPLYAEKRLRPIRLERADVEAHLERRETVVAP